MTDLANATPQAAAAQNVNPCRAVIYWTPSNKRVAVFLRRPHSGLGRSAHSRWPRFGGMGGTAARSRAGPGVPDGSR